jgi:hypothetical protein
MEFDSRATLCAMPAAAPAKDRKANRTALAREARRIAQEVEGLYISLSEKGDLANIRRYMIVHEGGAPNFDLLQTAKALRCYAGTLLLISGAPPLSETSADTVSPRQSEP